MSSTAVAIRYGSRVGLTYRVKLPQTHPVLCRVPRGGGVGKEQDILPLRMARRATWLAVDAGREHRAHKTAVLIAVPAGKGGPAAP